MEQFIRDIILMLGSAALGALGKTLLTPKERAEKTKAQSETIEIQGRTLSDAFKEIDKFHEEMQSLREINKQLQADNKAILQDNEKLVKRNIALWKFVIMMSEQMNKSDLPLPPIPVELETDPEIVKLKKRIDK